MNRSEMGLTRHTWILPACLLGIAAVAGTVAFMASGYSVLLSGIFALTVFCSLAVVFLYGWVIWRQRQTEKKLHESLLLEQEILARLSADETGRQYRVSPFELRLGDIERRLEATESSVEKTSAAPPTGGPAGDVVFDDKVVPINTTRRQSESDANEASQPARQKLAKMLDEGRYFFRLQPIINLLDKQVVGLEASAYCIHGDDVVPVSDFVGRIPGERQNRITLRLVKSIARLFRQLEKDGNLVPVHLELDLQSGSGDESWESLLQLVKADPVAQANLIPVIKDRMALRSNNNSEDKLLALREVGLKLCLSGVSTLKEVSEGINSRHFSFVKMPAANLLAYERNERDRVADQLLPMLEQRSIPIFASDVAEPHQASQLIDIAIAGAQGEYIAPPRSLNMFKDIDPLAMGQTQAQERPTA